LLVASATLLAAAASHLVYHHVLFTEATWQLWLF